MSAQKKQKTTIHIERADYSEYNEKFGKDVQRLVGNIILRHDSTFFYCDSARLFEKTQSFDGFGHIHINSSDSLHIYGDSIHYNGQTTVCVITGDVLLYDDSTTIETDVMSYDRTSKIANYPNKGVITRGDKVLTSSKGTYDSENNLIYFYNDVVVTTPDCKMLTDTLFYFTDAEIMTFFGPTTISDSTTTLYGEYGRYNTVSEEAVVNRNAFLQSEGQSISADSLFYNRNDDFARAHGNVTISDTSNKIIADCNYGELWKRLGMTFITDSLMLTYYENEDSLFLSSDSIRLTFDTASNRLQTAEAFNNVRFYRSDIQGKGDLLRYTKTDSTLVILKEPVLWSDSCQFTAVGIRMTTNLQKPDSVFLNGKGFIVMHDSIEGFNQIKGDTIIAKFIEGKLSKVNDTRNAEMIIYVREDDGSLTGMNRAKAPSIVLTAHDSKIRNVMYIGKSEETLYPEKEINSSNSLLTGFAWHNRIRPHSKDEVRTSPLPEIKKMSAMQAVEEPVYAPEPESRKRRRR